ncbi:methyltransferase domain-containing protein [Streptomyces sp. TR02-1]|uniref:methyltransferase domain-containing protein n=1 Tax=Streptomyces sp. TR02-1 TaxID=3385977 RepID=UPI0039A3CC06
MNNTWITPTDGASLADPYADHSGSLRGALRHQLVGRALAEHLPPAPQRVLDIGGGTGVQARMLADRGHHVTVLDPDQAMLDKARAERQHDDSCPGSVTFLLGAGEEAPHLAGTGWDAALCHGVLMYVEDPGPLMHAVARCVRPGGLVSILAKAASSLAMRRGLERDWSGVLTALHSNVESGSLGTVSRGIDRESVVQLLADQRIDLDHWYGVRCFTDHLGNEPVGGDFSEVLEAEWEAGRTDPYRQIARLFHLIAYARITRDDT